MNLMIIIKSSPEERKKIREALRLCAAMIGMDESPYVVFRSQGVECLKKGVIEDAEIAEYLQTVSDLAGVYYLKELNVGSISLDPVFDPIPLNIHELAEHILECKTVVTF